MGELARTNILLVDDSPCDAQLTVHAIERSGIAATVSWLQDAASALNYLCMRTTADARADGLPCLVILDHDMPGMTGAALLKHIRSHKSLSRVPVVMFSANDEPRVALTCQALGANSYVIKPNGFDEYVAQVQRVVRLWL
jgi:CheY-like chemotaxis protein